MIEKIFASYLNMKSKPTANQTPPQIPDEKKKEDKKPKMNN